MLKSLQSSKTELVEVSRWIGSAKWPHGIIIMRSEDIKDILINVPEKFGKFIDAALMRFGYLYPDVPIKLKDGEIFITSNEIEFFKLKQEILHLIYKEKIYEETLEIRKSIYKSISDD